MKVTQLIDRISKILLDPANKRFERNDILNYLNEGRRLIVTLKPESNNKVEDIKLEPGVMQSIPKSGFKFLGASITKGAAGTVFGTATPISLIDLVYELPDFAKHTPDPVVSHYIRLPENPDKFYVYPPQPEGIETQGYLQISYAAIPDDLAETTSPGGDRTEFDLGNEYESAIIDFCISRCLAWQSKSQIDIINSQNYYQSFLQKIGAQNSFKPITGGL